ncbi:TPA: hypothetical protein ACVU30_001529 [Vibrio parahaemolyticus]|uniref:hypothetical protein n=1 Tax=Vibrio parahaemolyticus TaxID=670 RepID=UPI00111D57ED|nr:hypothetical protein [Vibrio parahaemolyticus]EKO5174331.1 hypothetical protein [Vibrio vulnificus]EIV8655092.1 hypothetical protein [Vibrio parahaemolyticus]EKO5193817.1 hypothetical protein [Vibrio vulnificus]EKO5206633.1 hypothetical protein [Vibrio parahaemolyticus]TOF06417.1 hypothetical protein CGJ29_16725 [Vibrio parahaemolyticus]
MIIVYGYYKGEPMELIGKSLDQQGTFIAAKPIGRIDNRLTFAALVESPDPIHFPVVLPHCVLVKEQTYTHKPYKPHLVNTAVMDAKQRKTYCKKLKKRQPLSTSNWKLHISRNRGLKWIHDHLAA